MTGLPLIGRRPSAHKSAKPFLFICFFSLVFSVRQRSARAWAAALEMGLGWGESEGQRACGFSSRRRPPPTSGFGVSGPKPSRALPPPRGAPESAGPAHVAGCPGRRARRPPHNGDQSRPRAYPPPRASRARGAPEGSRTGLPRWGRGGSGGGRRPSSFSNRDGYLTSLSAGPLSRPGHPEKQAAPNLGILAVAGATAVPPYSPVDAIFSLLPSRSLNVRLPLAFPLGAALRRRETRNLGCYHRARPRGWEREGRTTAFSPFAPATLVLILSKEHRM